MKTKSNNNMIISAALSLAIIFSACGEKGETLAPDPETQTTDTLLAVAIDNDAFAFGSKGIETFILSVVNTTEWEVRNEASWVVTEKQADNTLRVNVTPSRNPLDRSATLTIVATNPDQGETSFVVTQAHGTPRLYVRQLQGGIAVRHCSENGLWATGQKSTQVVVADISKLSDDAYTGTLTSMNGVHSIDNTGKPYENGCSGDGTLYSDYETQRAVDNGVDQEFSPAHYTPYIMRNNRRIDLPHPETYATSNIAIEGYVTRHLYQGCIPDKVSADGKHIYGRLMNTQSMWFAAKWTRIGATNDYTFKVLGLNGDGDLNSWDTVYSEFEGATYMTIEPASFLCPQNVSGLSVYGKYACGHYGASLSGGGQLFRYDMEADQLDLLDATGIAVYITDDGTLFTADNTVYKVGAAAPITLKEWLTEIYGEEIANSVGYQNMGSVSVDYSTTILYDPSSIGGSNGASYIITVEP
jgi:hypothetical protein